MFGSETIEVAIGMAMLLTFMSLFATAARETIESVRKDRARLVHQAMAELFSETGDQNSPTVKRFYNSIVISPLFRGAYNGVKGELPSYITPSNFATTILDMAREEAKAAPGAPIGDWIDRVGNARVSQLVRLAFTTAGKDPDKTNGFLEDWFNGQMDRVSGWYKRSTHTILLIIGFVSAAAINVDAIAITKHLYRNDALREVIVAHAQAKPPQVPVAPNGAGNGSAPAPQQTASPDQILGELRDYGFPMGWSWQGRWPTPAPQCTLMTRAGSGNASGCALDTIGLSAVLLMIFGWIVTAFGVSLGAPFWFDLLNKFMVIRSTVKPDEKSPPEGSKDRQPSAPAVVPAAVAEEKKPDGS